MALAFVLFSTLIGVGLVASIMFLALLEVAFNPVNAFADPSRESSVNCRPAPLRVRLERIGKSTQSA